ncbi:hypothetical protein Vadar_006287 [Vaccinium darrowii]|uniref:Uncharacterized protein n=1 Tax=Vaccinium darrowii TaxID=229202 RepID=A0ACB7Z9U8_9ERIC|nr:hypothetical protein Vadar_006287 [Vaccinium darrowii]
MTADGRISQAYYNGVNSFIEFAREVVDGKGNIPCPCLQCVNFYHKSPEDVRIHLLRHGIMQSYIVWHDHGEPRVSENVCHREMRDGQDGDLGGIDALLQDQMRGESVDTTQWEEMRNFDKLLNDAQRELYPGCESYTLLKYVIEVFNMKENATLDRCPKCNVSRYETNCGRGNKIARKVLRYFPLTPRLKRLFMTRMIAEYMRWHMDNPGDGDESRHPAHGDEWKDFDVKYLEFAHEARIVRLGLAIDGFNPFGNMSSSYSCGRLVH